MLVVVLGLFVVYFVLGVFVPPLFLMVSRRQGYVASLRDWVGLMRIMGDGLNGKKGLV